MNIAMVLDYLAELERNNNPQWFHCNKEQYQEAKTNFETLINQLAEEMRKNGDSIPLLEPKEFTFKIQRDTRFSHDKSPYLPAFRAHLSSKGKLPIPVGYYIMLQPGGRSFLGGGLFADMFKDATTMVRDFISSHGGEWEGIIESPEFKEFFSVGGSTLKKTPKGYDPEHPQDKYIKQKSWYLEYPVPDSRFKQDGILDYIAGIFLRMRPFNTFLNLALEGFDFPKRQ